MRVVFLYSPHFIKLEFFLLYISSQSEITTLNLRLNKSHHTYTKTINVVGVFAVCV